LSYLHSKEQVFLASSLFHGQSSHHPMHVIEPVILHCADVKQCDCMPLRHPKGPISKWPQYFHDIIDNRPFIVSCIERPVITVFCILKPLACEFP
jgi:hypothetical protein